MRFDMVVIGSGPAGEKAAAQAAYVGKRVALVDRESTLGGSSVRNAMVPSKTLRETALYLTGFDRRNVYGVSLSLDPEMTLRHLMTRTEEVRWSMADAVRRNMERHGVAVFAGEGSLSGERTVTVRTPTGSEELQAEVVLIATGSRPHRPPHIPFDDPDVYDSEEIIDLDRIPGSLLVVGGGVVGSEYASIFTALGTKVTLVDAGDRLIPFLDREISDLLARSFTDVGMRLVQGSGVDALERRGDGLLVRLVDGETISPEKVLYAAGRAGNTEGMGLQEAGVKVDERGRVLVDETFRTSAEGVYAAGDVIGRPALASVSMEQGRVAVCHAFDIPFKEYVDPLPPFGVYTIPEAAMAGMTEEEARAQGVDHEVGRGWFRDNPRANVSGLTEGLVKLVFRRNDRTLLGVHILGEGATELVHVGQMVIHVGGTIDRFIDATFNVPTRSDAYKYAAYDGLQRLAGRTLG